MVLLKNLLSQGPAFSTILILDNGEWGEKPKEIRDRCRAGVGGKQNPSVANYSESKVSSVYVSELFLHYLSCSSFLVSCELWAMSNRDMNCMWLSFVWKFPYCILMYVIYACWLDLCMRMEYGSLIYEYVFLVRSAALKLLSFFRILFSSLIFWGSWRSIEAV